MFDIGIKEFASLVLKLFILLTFVFLLVTIYRSLSNDHFILEPIQMPKNLVDAGYDGVTFVNQIQDEIVGLKNKVNSIKQDSTEFEVNFGQDLNMQIMGLGVSSASLSYHLKEVLGIKSKIITGELIDIDNTLKLTLRLSNFPVQKIVYPYQQGLKGKALEAVVKLSAEKVLFFTDPYHLAINKFTEEDLTEAERIIRYMIDERPKDHKWAYLAWGSLHAKRGDKKKALLMYHKSLEVDPNFLLPNMRVAWTLFNEEKYEEAITYFERGLINDQAHFGVNNGLAMSYLRTGDTQESEKYYKKNINDFPNTLWAYANYSNFLLNIKKDTVGFEEVLELAKSSVDNNADYYAAQAGSMLMMNNLDSVEHYIDLALVHDPEHPASLQIAGSFYHNIKRDYNAAEPILRTNIQVMEKLGYERSMIVSGYNSLAMNDYYTGQYDSAIVHVDRAIALDPSNAFPWSTKAETYAYMQDTRRFYRYLDSAMVRGFNVALYLDEEPYNNYAQEAEFKALLNKQNTLKN